MSTVTRNIFKSICGRTGRGVTGGADRPFWAQDLQTGTLLAYYKGDIVGGRLQAYRPLGSATPQVKGSLFSVAVPEGVPYTGLLTTDVITASGTAPTCAVDGTLSMTANFWDMSIHRDGALWAYLPGINIGATFELDASGNGHHLYLTTTTIVEVVDGTGTNWCNEMGFAVADGSQYLSDTDGGVILPGSRIPVLIDGSGCASYSITAGDIPEEVVSLWNASTPTASVSGPAPEYSSASQQPDANGNLVDWPNYIATRGVEVHPAYTQLAQNSKLLNAVAGSPGTGPDNWTYTVVDTPSLAVTARTVGNSLTFSGTASRGYLSMTQAMAALSVYTFSFNAICDGVLQIDEIQYCSLTGGTIVVSMDGVVVADENAVPSAGVHAFSIKVTAGAVGDTAAFRFGLGASAVATGTVTVYEPQLVLGAYVLPYAASGVGATVATASTAATSAGNGLAIPLDARMRECLERSVTDGMELIPNGDFSAGLTGGWTTSNWSVVAGVAIGGNGGALLTTSAFAAQVGKAYLVNFTVLATQYLNVSVGGVSQVYYAPTVVSKVVVATSTAGITFTPGGAIPSQIDNISIQRLAPSVFTAAALCWMGVGNADLPAGVSTTVPVLTLRDTTTGPSFCQQSSGGLGSSQRALDGTTETAIFQSWNRGEVHLKVVQTNALGTQFRVGNRRYTSAMVPIDALTWDVWANYDGSMNPLTHLRFGYTSTVPLGFLQTQVWNKSCADAEILNLLRYAS